MATVGNILVVVLVAGATWAAATSLGIPIGRITNNPNWAPGSTAARSGRVALAVAAGAGWLATLTLTWGFVATDWSLAYVSDYTRPQAAWPLRMAGVWAGPEGSLLLWTTMVATAALITARSDMGGPNPARSDMGDPNPAGRGVAAHGLAAGLAAGHGAVTLVLANPFERLASPPSAGTGLQPVLEHPAMVWHPPLLYLGMASMLIPAGLAAARHTRHQPVSAALRRSLLWATGLLAAGLATGANWAYVELGWGGYWAWDPIENAGLIAWLTAASTIHRLKPGQPLTAAPLGLTLAPAVATVWATTITRTGVLNSVHSFADQPTLRMWLLIVAAAFTILAAFIPVAVERRNRSVDVDGRSAAATGGPSVSGMATLSAAAVVVAIGTYGPAFEWLVGGAQAVTGGRYFTTALWPVVVLGSLARLAVTRSKPGAVVPALSGVAALAAMAVTGAAAGPFGLTVAALGGSVVGAMVARSVSSGDKVRPALATNLAHLGMGLLLVGVAGTTTTTTATVVAPIDVDTPVDLGTRQAMAAAQGAEAGSPTTLTVRFRGVTLTEQDGLRQAVADITVDGHRFEPRLVSYVRTGATSVETDTHRAWTLDTQISLVDANSEQAIIRISRHPLMSLVWLGAAAVVIGLLAAAVTGTDGTARRRPPAARSVPTSLP